MTLVDTNLLLRLAQSTHPMYRKAFDALAELDRQAEALCIVPQTLYEFWVVATRPAAQNGLGFSVPNAHSEMTRLRALFQLLEDTPAILPEWEQLVTHYAVSGRNAHDARLVAAMNVHGVGRILTFNDADFRRFPVTVITPDEVLGSTGGAPPPSPVP